MKIKYNTYIFPNPDPNVDEIWTIGITHHAFYGKNPTFIVDKRNRIEGGMHIYKLRIRDKFRCWLAVHWPWLEQRLPHKLFI